MKKRTVAVLLTLTLVVGGVIGGTVAYLTTSTNKVVNTFTVGDINITLTETKGPDGKELADSQAWSAKLTPGSTYTKDPVVTVVKGSEDCWLFVKVTEDANRYLEYTSNLTEVNGWSAYTEGGVTGVYYRKVTNVTENAVFHLIAGDPKDETDPITGKVTVNPELAKRGTKNATLEMPEASVTLTYKAAAVQLTNIPNVADAYKQVKDLLG